jgi:hypothetical protein
MGPKIWTSKPAKKEKSSFIVKPPDHENVYWACEYILRSLSSSPAGKQNQVKRLHFFYVQCSCIKLSMYA